VEEKMKYGRIMKEVAPGAFNDLASRGEPVFVIRAQDIHSAAAVLFYAHLRREDGDVKGALECEAIAAAMSDWPKKKRPD